MRTGFLNSPTFWVRFATVVVVASVGLALAHLTWRLVGWDDGRTRIQTPETLAPVGGGAGGGVAAILALNPFGGGSAGAEGLPASTLGLVLKGVIYSTAPEESSALIAAGSGLAQTYGVGQSPLGNAVIESIEMDRVVLNVGGRREALAFPQSAGAATLISPAPAQPPAVAAPTPGTAAAPASASAAGAATGQTADRSGGSSGGPALAAAATPGLSATGDGYRIGPEAPAQLLRAGLRPGDLIRTVNGRPVGDLTSDSQLFARASGVGSARVELVRDGRPLTLTFPLR